MDLVIFNCLIPIYAMYLVYLKKRRDQTDLHPWLMNTVSNFAPITTIVQKYMESTSPSTIRRLESLNNTNNWGFYKKVQFL